MAGSWSGNTYTGDGTNETVTAGAGVHTIYGRGGKDSLSGGDGDDFLHGEEGDDTLVGGNGNDLLSGGAGKDLLSGGVGNDVLVFDWVPGITVVDTLDGGAGNDELRFGLGTGGQVGAAISQAVVITLGASPVLTIGGVSRASLVSIERLTMDAHDWLGKITATGGALNDTFLLGSGADVANGGVGDDSIEGNGGYDSIRGGSGKDTLLGGAGNDTLRGDAGTDSLDDSDYYGPVPVGLDNDLLDGGDSTDYLTTVYGRDTLYGGAGDDFLIFHAAATPRADSSMNGGTGEDTLAVFFYSGFGNLSETVTFTVGATLKLTVGATTLLTGSEIEHTHLEATWQTGQVNVTGGSGRDTINTGTGDDSILGGAGDDEIASQEGADTVFAGQGNDEVIVTNDKGKVVDMGEGNDYLVVSQGSFVGVVYEHGSSYEGGAGTDTANFASYYSSEALLWNVDTAWLNGNLVGQMKHFELFRVYAGASNDTILGGSGADDFAGNEGNDSIVANGGADSLYAGTGSDTLDGGAGDDRIDANLDTGAEDLLKGGANNDLLRFSLAYLSPSLVMTGDLQTGATLKVNNVIVATASQFEQVNLVASGNNDTLLGATGNDTIDAGLGADKVTTGTGNDTVRLDIGKVSGSTLSTEKDTIDLGGGTADLLSGTSTIAVGKMVMLGTLANLTIKGGAAGDKIILTGLGIEQVSITTDTDGLSSGVYRDDNLFGGALNDTLDAGGGKNTLKGNGGDDRIVLRVDNLKDVVDGGVGTLDLLKLNGAGQNGFSTSLVSGVYSVKRGATEVINAIGIELFDIEGSAFADTIVGGAGKDTVKGGGGADSISTGAGDDSITGSSSGETINAGDGIDTITSSGGSDKVDGGLGVDFFKIGSAFSAAGVSVTLTAATEANVTSGGVVLARIKNIENFEGSTGADTITGDAQNNLISGFGKNSQIDGGAGTDTVKFAYAGWYEGTTVTLSGATFAPVTSGPEGTKIRNVENVIGSTGHDRITGDGVANRIEGDTGNDTLSGGLAMDTLTGGLGRDFFFFLTAAAAANVDTITDFKPGEDRIVLDDAVYASLGTSVIAAEVVALASGNVATNASQRLIYDKSNGKLWIDADGNASGAAPIQIAQLGTTAVHPTTLVHTDFIMI